MTNMKAIVKRFYMKIYGKLFLPTTLVTFLMNMSPLFIEDASAAMIEDQQLHFGTFALVDNLTVSTLKVPYNGTNPVATNKLYPLSFGQAGNYSLSAFPAFTPLIISISDYELKIGVSEPFTVGSFTHESIITDVNGEAQLRLGATLSTSGTGTLYGDAVYSGNMNIVISW